MEWWEVVTCHPQICCPPRLASLGFSQRHLWTLPTLNPSSITPPSDFFSPMSPRSSREKSRHLLTGTLWGRVNDSSPLCGSNLVPREHWVTSHGGSLPRERRRIRERAWFPALDICILLKCRRINPLKPRQLNWPAQGHRISVKAEIRIWYLSQRLNWVLISNGNNNVYWVLTMCQALF